MRTHGARSRGLSPVLVLIGGGVLGGWACVAPRPHLVDDLEALSADGNVRVVVEIPAGTLAKYEVDKDSGELDWEWVDGSPRVVRYLAYPGNYGMVPRTLVADGDGDPVDVLVLGAAAERGSVLEVRPIGLLHMTDRGERDDKLIAVVDGSPFESVGSIGELDSNFPGVTEIVRIWFEHYKGRPADGVPGTVVEGFGDADLAREVLERARAAYDARP